MPQTKIQKFIFALITVSITVPCFVFYCSSLSEGEFNIDIIKNCLIFIPIEFVLALISEIFIGSKLSLKIAFKVIDVQKTSAFMIETIIICATVCVMCPLMSFYATILYDGVINVLLGNGNLSEYLINFIPYWLQKVVLNFPFALCTQLFFIQPFVRMIFKAIYLKPSKNKLSENNA